MGLIKKTYKNIKDFLIKYCTAFYKMFLELIQKINCFLISFFSKHIAPYLQKFSIQISQMKCSEVREETNSLKKEIKSNRTRIWMSRILHTYLFIYIYIFIILFHKEPSILDYTQAICCLYLSFSSFYIWYRTIRVILNFKSNGLTKILMIALETIVIFFVCIVSILCALLFSEYNLFVMRELS